MDDIKGLERWYADYAVAEIDYPIPDTSIFSGVLRALDGDELDDTDSIERKIAETTPYITISEGFCSKCQNSFDNWPNFIETPHPKKNPTKTPKHSINTESGFEDSEVQSDSDESTKYTLGEVFVRPSHANTYELEASSRIGCQFCAVLMQSLIDEDLLNTYRKIEKRLSRLDKSAALQIAIQKWGWDGHSQNLWLNFPGKFCHDVNSSAFHLTSSFVKTTGSLHLDVEPLDLAKDWLTTCLTSHKHCDQLNDNTVLPTRLLSVSTEPPRLVLTADWTTRPKYATLSHCWGNKDFFKLVPDNLEALLSKISVDRLPKTFRDAIEITRKLGLHYIWIDSLCIIQGNANDWEHEATTMSSVYSGSSINIAASSAIDGSQGCFLKPKFFSDGFRTEISMGGSKRLFDFRCPEIYKKATVESHLATRAWALQEKILAPRSLHSGNRGLFWECRELCASEFLPEGWSGLERPLVRRNRLSTLQNLWPHFVFEYSRCFLTFSRDKLVALSGIARYVQNESRDQYFAGMWRRNLEVQLCWRAISPEIKPRHFQAPSWSWASINGGVRHQTGVLSHSRENEYTHVVDVHMTLMGKDSFGQVSGGVLTLACSVMAIGRLSHVFRPGQWGMFGIEPGKFEDIELVTQEQHYSFRIRRDYILTNSENSGGTVHILPFYRGRNGTSTKVGKKWIDHLAIEGIVLQATGDAQGQYRRIGSFSFQFDSEVDDYHPFFKILDESGTATAEAACQKVIENVKHPKERYVITVV